MPTMNISLTKELAELIHSKVGSGYYGSASEVVREALRRFDVNDHLLYELQMNRLKEVLAPSIEQALNGEFVKYSHDELMAEIDAELGG